MLNEKSMQLQAKRSFAVARDFDSKRLDEMKTAFLKEFISDAGAN